MVDVLNHSTKITRGSGDVLAERIRALGHFSPGSFAQFTSFGNIKEDVLKFPVLMICSNDCLADHEFICVKFAKLFPVIQKWVMRLAVITLIERITTA